MLFVRYLYSSFCVSAINIKRPFKETCNINILFLRCIFQMSNWLGAQNESCSNPFHSDEVYSPLSMFTIDVELGLDFVCDSFNGVDHPHSQEDLTY